MNAIVTAVSRSPVHGFSKASQPSIRLIAGHGVEGDAHAGETVQHLSRVARDPTQPNLRQVHLIAAETHQALRAAGFNVYPGAMGENVTTQGLDLFALPTGTRLRLGEAAVVEITGLRNPCTQIDRFQDGLMAATLGRDERGGVIFRAGVMGIVVEGGDVGPGDPIAVELPATPHRRLERV